MYALPIHITTTQHKPVASPLLMRWRCTTVLSEAVASVIFSQQSLYKTGKLQSRLSRMGLQVGDWDEINRVSQGYCDC